MRKFLKYKKNKKYSLYISSEIISSVIQGIAWRINLNNHCRIRAFVVFCTYHDLGKRVNFYYGVNRDDNKMLVHSWVEDEQGQNISDWEQADKTFEKILEL